MYFFNQAILSNESPPCMHALRLQGILEAWKVYSLFAILEA